MALIPGTRLGPYEVSVAIGSGGMGEVYRARDTRLNRDVAIKVLPESFAADPERRARFEREAQAIAALSHPNILAIHDTGIHDRQLFVVTEFLDGETLRARMQTGPLPIKKAIDIAAHLARGLAAAHDKSLVHRDLKPENVFLLKDGQVKILDFGLARQMTTATDATATVNALTDPGVVMGTVGYMAPEQVRGHTVDARADLFALGAVLYEMLSGRRAFQRDTAAETMTAILHEDPPELTSSRRADLSPTLDRIVRHCLEKNPAERFQSARDVAFALEALSGTSMSSSAISAAPSDAGNRRRVLVTAGLVVAALAAGVAIDRLVGSSSRTAPLPTFALRSFEPLNVFSARFMPDGETIVYSGAFTGTEPSMFVLRAESTTAERIGAPRTHLLAISSKGELAVLTDARYLAQRLFEGTLATMPIGGSPRPLSVHVREADWAPSGDKLAVIRDAGTEDRLEFPIDNIVYKAAGYLSDLRVSPDGSRLAFIEHPWRTFDDRGIVKVVDLDRGVTALVGEFNSLQGLAWRQDGTAVLFSATPMWSGRTRRPWWHRDVYTATVSDGAEPRVALSTAAGLLIQDVARDGRLLGWRADHSFKVRAHLRDEVSERELGWLDGSFFPWIASDGDSVLYSDQGAGSGYGYGVSWRKADDAPPVELGTGNAYGLSPDGKWALALTNETRQQVVLYSTGAEKPVQLDRGTLERIDSVSWFPSGERVLVCGAEPSRHSRCYGQTRGSRPEPLTADGAARGWVRPDGRMMLGTDSRTWNGAGGKWQLYPLDGGQPQPVQNMGPQDLMAGWHEDGRSIFVARRTAASVFLDRLDPNTGKSQPIRALAPPDLTGVLGVDFVSATADGRWYAYSYQRWMSTLFIVSGVEGR